MVHRRFHALAAALLLAAPAPAPAQQQMADPDFKTSVNRPAHSKNGPVVVFDEAHANFHTESGRYKPFADLLRGDGYTVKAGVTTFHRETLAGVGVLVIANAGVPKAAGAVDPAFTDAECDAVRDWVSQGGSLLLIADHAPFGSASEILGKRFGIAMGKGWVFDRKEAGGITTTIDFSRANGRLGSHPILNGRDSTEAVSLVRAFTGQSLTVPEGATALMRLGPTAREAPDQTALNAAAADTLEAQPAGSGPDPDRRGPSVAGRAQGIALTLGKGRVVVLGEAGMLSAQVIRFQQGDRTNEMKFGMNVPGTDDRQFGLNVMRWLSRVLN